MPEAHALLDLRRELNWEDHIDTDWSDLLHDRLGPITAAAITQSPDWPSLVAAVDRTVRHGWAVDNLLDLTPHDQVDDVDLAQALTWRIAIVTDPPPTYTGDDGVPVDPVNLLDQVPDDLDALRTDETLLPHQPETPDDDVMTGRTAPGSPPDVDPPDVDPPDVDPLEVAAHRRRSLGPLEPSDADITRMLDRAWEQDTAAVTLERVWEINEMTAQFYESQLRGSWAHLHLHERLGLDLAVDERFRPGYAPAGWTTLIDHLHTHGVTDTELVVAGVAKTAANGRLIDRFRDRAVLPVITNDQVIAFIGRRHPDNGEDPKAGPKYLNSPETVAFRKSAQLYGLPNDHIGLGSIPVLVEGPLDAIAVTTASAGAYIGVAPLGTSLTVDQAAQLAALHNQPVVATDGDLAGHIAAERDYWLLTPHGLDPHTIRFAAGEDPASVLQTTGPAALVAQLQQAGRLADVLITERLTNLTPCQEQLDAVAALIATGPPDTWTHQIATHTTDLNVEPADLRQVVATQANAFTTDRRRFSSHQLDHVSAIRHRLENAATAAPEDRWAPLARTLDPRLLTAHDWPATAATLQDLHNTGHDVPTITRDAAAEPLGQEPAQELRYRLVARLGQDDLAGQAPWPPQRGHGSTGDTFRRVPMNSRPPAGPTR